MAMVSDGTRGLGRTGSPRMRTTATTTRAQMRDRKPALAWREWSQMWRGVHGERRPRPATERDMSQKSALCGWEQARWPGEQRDPGVVCSRATNESMRKAADLSNRTGRKFHT